MQAQSRFIAFQWENRSDKGTLWIDTEDLTLEEFKERIGWTDGSGSMNQIWNHNIGDFINPEDIFKAQTWQDSNVLRLQLQGYHLTDKRDPQIPSLDWEDFMNQVRKLKGDQAEIQKEKKERKIEPFSVSKDYVSEAQTAGERSAELYSQDPLTEFMKSHFEERKNADLKLIQPEKVIKIATGIQHKRQEYIKEKIEELKKTNQEPTEQNIPLPVVTLPENIAKGPQEEGFWEDLKEKLSIQQLTAYLADKARILSVRLLNGDKTLSEDEIKQYEQYSTTDIFKFMIEPTKSMLEYKMAGDIKNYLPPNERDIIYFNESDKIALLGDWGTGKDDANALLEKLVIEKEANIVIHLGDVYYSGRPKQYERITNKLAELRATLKMKYGRSLRYYAIAGNHDYYTEGRPFHAHLQECNEKKKLQFIQRRAYFCLRSKNHQIQFVGLNTGKNQHSLAHPINIFFNGTRLEEEQRKWAIQTIKQFPGKTVLLTHHPMFSTFEKILGSWTDIGNESENVDPTLTSQLFQILPKITCWFWGHEHRFSVFKGNSFGINRAILLGNSAIPVNEHLYYQVRYPSGGITEMDFFPKQQPYGKGNFYEITGAVLSNFKQKEPITATYVYLTGVNPDKKVRILTDRYQEPVHPLIDDHTTYHILQESGLSIGLDNVRICLQTKTVPAKLRLQKIGDSSLQTRALIFDQTTKQYLCIENDEVKLNLYDINGVQNRTNYHWQLQISTEEQDQQHLKVGTIFKLKNLGVDRWVKKNFKKPTFYLQPTKDVKKASRFYIYFPHVEIKPQ